MRRATRAGLLTLLLTLPLAHAGEPVSGPLYLQDALIVPAGDTLTLTPGTSVTGAAADMPAVAPHEEVPVGVGD